MLIRFGLGGQMSGSVGGVTAGHNKGGQYLRNRSIPTNPNSIRQQAARSAFGTAAQAWKSITQTQRDAWESYANQTPIVNRLGESITISGSSMYTRTNAFRLQAGLALLAAAPLTPGLASIGTVTSAENDTTGFLLSIDLTGGDLLESVIVQMGPAVSAGVTSFNGPYTLLAFSDSDGSTIEADTDTTTRYGQPQVGERRPYRLRGIDSAGRLSNVAQGFFESVAV